MDWFFLAVICVITSLLAMMLWAEGHLDSHDAVFWPIALAKWLLKQLWLVLFTGWRL